MGARKGSKSANARRGIPAIAKAADAAARRLRANKRRHRSLTCKSAISASTVEGIGAIRSIVICPSRS